MASVKYYKIKIKTKICCVDLQDAALSALNLQLPGLQHHFPQDVWFVLNYPKLFKTVS